MKRDLASISAQRFRSLRAECWEVNAELWRDKLPTDHFRQRVFDAVSTQVSAGRAESMRFSLADVGCGDGSFLQLQNQRSMCIQLTGIDSCSDFIKHDRESRPGITFVNGDIEAEPFPSIGKFDCVTNILSLIEVNDLERALRNVRSILVDQGLFLLFILDADRELDRYQSGKKAKPGSSIFTVNGEIVIGSHFMVGSRRSIAPYYRFVRSAERYTTAMEKAGISVLQKQLVTLDDKLSTAQPQGFLISGSADVRGY